MSIKETQTRDEMNTFAIFVAAKFRFHAHIELSIINFFLAALREFTEIRVRFL